MSIKMPQRLDATNLSRNINETSSAVSDGRGSIKWVPARPLPYCYNFIKSVVERLKMARDVFKGKADALYWDNQ